jgi:hypothetical protein
MKSWELNNGPPRNLRRLVSKASPPIIVSSLTLLECFGVVMEHYRKGKLKKKQVNDLYQRLDKDIGENKDTKISYQKSGPCCRIDWYEFLLLNLKTRIEYKQGLIGFVLDKKWAMLSD